MLNQNDPRAGSAEAVECCFLAGRSDGLTPLALRTEVLTRRYHLNPSRAMILAALAYGDSA